ncbi:MAG TPA: hypothetical protein PKI61_03380 [bacterium]|nr:hypothetical protein [bacterium]HPT30110.1 hypothetical protein [bacterium]
MGNDIIATSSDTFNLVDFWPVLVILVVGGLVFLLVKKYFSD